MPQLIRTMVTRPVLQLLILLAAVFLSACLAQPHPNKNLFNLNPEPAEIQDQPKVGRRVALMTTVTSASGYERRALVYKVGPDQFKVDFYNEFLAPPARLLADQAAQFLNRSSSRLRVVKTPGLAPADYGLETYLEYLYGDFTGPTPKAEMAVRFTFNDLKGDRPRVLLDRTYRQTIPMFDNSPAAQAEALSRCLAVILEDLNRDLSRVVR